MNDGGFGGGWHIPPNLALVLTWCRPNLHYICDAEERMAAKARSIKSAERTLALFELFSREQQPFTVGHISEALRIPQPQRQHAAAQPHGTGISGT